MTSDQESKFIRVARLWRGRVIGVVGGFLVVGLFLAWAFRAQPVEADFAPVIRGDLVTTVEDEGETRIHDLYIVSAPVAGRIRRIELEVGDLVVANETVLALFTPADPALYDVRARSEAEAGLRTAQADETKVKADLEFAKAELGRAAELNQKGAVSRVALDRAQLAVKTAQAAVTQAAAITQKRRADLKTAHGALTGTPAAEGAAAYIQVRVPVSGRVLKRVQQSEAVLTAGTPILEIGDPANLEIVTDLLSADAVKVHVGDPVIIEEWGGAHPLEGKVYRIEPFGFTKVSALGIEEQRVNVVIKFASHPEKWRALGHGYRVVTRIVIHRSTGVLKVPVSALFRTGSDWTVFAYTAGRAQLRKVTVKERNNTEAEIDAGLADNEKVIVHPSDRIADGIKVIPRG